jgi:hypothetical protein
MTDEAIEIKQEMFEELKKAINGSKQKVIYDKKGMPWEEWEEDFLMEYNKKWVDGVGLVKAKHIAKVLGRTLGSVQNKYLNLSLLRE